MKSLILRFNISLNLIQIFLCAFWVRQGIPFFTQYDFRTYEGNFWSKYELIRNLGKNTRLAYVITGIIFIISKNMVMVLRMRIFTTLIIDFVRNRIKLI